VTKYVAGATGTVASYLHFNSRVGVLVALECETPSGVANPATAELAKSIAMHIAMAAPEVLRLEELDPSRLERERALLAEQARKGGKPETTIEKIVEGQLRKLRAEVCLLEQPYIRDEKGRTTIADLLAQASKQIGEAVSVNAFARYSLDETVGETQAQ
jgi:elongation factor Ts